MLAVREESARHNRNTRIPYLYTGKDTLLRRKIKGSERKESKVGSWPKRMVRLLIGKCSPTSKPLTVTLSRGRFPFWGLSLGIALLLKRE